MDGDREEMERQRMSDFVRKRIEALNSRSPSVRSMTSSTSAPQSQKSEIGKANVHYGKDSLVSSPSLNSLVTQSREFNKKFFNTSERNKINSNSDSKDRNDGNSINNDSNNNRDDSYEDNSTSNSNNERSNVNSISNNYNSESIDGELSH